MKTLCLDQASRTTGYAIFDGQSLIKVDKFTLVNSNFGKRINQFRQKIKQLIEDNNIEQVFFEEIQLQQNVDTFKKLAMIYGAALSLMEEMGLPYDIISSNTWKSKCKIKKTVRETEKQAAQKFVTQTYGLTVTEDEADAICIGYSQLVKPDHDWSK